MQQQQHCCAPQDSGVCSSRYPRQVGCIKQKTAEHRRHHHHQPLFPILSYQRSPVRVARSDGLHERGHQKRRGEAPLHLHVEVLTAHHGRTTTCYSIILVVNVNIHITSYHTTTLNTYHLLHVTKLFDERPQQQRSDILSEAVSRQQTSNRHSKTDGQIGRQTGRPFDTQAESKQQTHGNFLQNVQQVRQAPLPPEPGELLRSHVDLPHDGLIPCQDRLVHEVVTPPALDVHVRPGLQESLGRDDETQNTNQPTNQPTGGS